MANDKEFKVKNGLSAKRYLGKVGTQTDTTETSYYQLSEAVSDSKQVIVSGQDNAAWNIKFKPDGTIMYMVGDTNNSVYQYTLSTAWDVSTASYASKSFVFSTQSGSPIDVFFKSDGTKMYVCSDSPDAVLQYSLSTAWDVSSASYDSVSFSVASETTGPYAFHFKPDGTKLYVTTTNTVYQYTLSTAWDISTASYDSVSYAHGGGNGYSVTFKPDGTKMYTVLYTTNSIVYEHSLSTAWDISTASQSGVTFTTGLTSVHSAQFSADGDKMYLLSVGGTDVVYQYSVDYTTQDTTIDLLTGNYFNSTLIYPTTLAFSNPPETDKALLFTLEISNSAETTTWPSGIKWHYGQTPDVFSDKQIFTFLTVDGGTTYYGKKAGETFS